jgi:hypothetical protein
MTSLVLKKLKFLYKWLIGLKSKIHKGVKFEFETVELGFTIATTVETM